MSNFLLTILLDGKTYWTESFETKRDLNAWLKNEQEKKNWNPKFTVDIKDFSKEVADAEEKRLKQFMAIQEKQAHALDGLVKFRMIEKPGQDEVLQAFNKVLDLMAVPKPSDTVEAIKKKG